MHRTVECDNKVVYRSRCITEPEWASQWQPGGSRLQVSILTSNQWICSEIIVCCQLKSEGPGPQLLNWACLYNILEWPPKIYLWPKNAFLVLKGHFGRSYWAGFIGWDGWNMWAALLIECRYVFTFHINHHQWRLDALSRCECMMECENPSSSDSVPLWPVLSCCESPILFIYYILTFYIFIS